MGNEKLLYNGNEVLGIESQNQYLIGDLIHQVGTAIIVGPPDAGKSQFLRQLILSIWNSQDFIGFKINALKKGALIVLTEDDVIATKSSLSKQMISRLENHNLDQIFFLQADTLSPKEIVDYIKTILSKHPEMGIVGIDSFGDILVGKKSNDVGETREAIQEFQKIAVEFKVLVILLHHVVKSSYRSSPSQDQVLGSSGIAQKVRLILDLRSGPENNGLKYLTVVKGNYVSRDLKKEAIELYFDEKSLLFRPTGKKIIISELNYNDTAYTQKKVEIAWAEILIGDNTYSTRRLVDLLQDNYKLSERSCERRIEEAVESGILNRTKQGQYQPSTDKFPPKRHTITLGGLAETQKNNGAALSLEEIIDNNYNYNRWGKK